MCADSDQSLRISQLESHGQFAEPNNNRRNYGGSKNPIMVILQSNHKP